MASNPNKYYTGDYFLDYNKNLCVIEHVHECVSIYTRVRIKNIQTNIKSSFVLHNDKTIEKHIFKWLGQIDGKAAQVLYIKEHYGPKKPYYLVDGIIVEWNSSRKNT